MQRRHFSRLMLITVIIALCIPAVFLTGCTSEGGVLKENLPPKVWLSSAPPEGTVNSYTIHLFWGGWDPDGEIAYYEYAITDNEDGPFDPADTTGADKWNKVWSNDSLLSFTADVLADTNTTELAAEFRRSHTFFIRAIDEQGLATPEPAYRSFTARTLSPEVIIDVPRRVKLNPASLSPISTYRWRARDYIDDKTSVQDPDSVQWILEDVNKHNGNYDDTIDYIRSLPPDSPRWDETPWVSYSAPQDSGKSWTTRPTDFGPYVFAIRAKDEAGAITPVFDEAYNVRRVLVSRRTTGPTLTVKNIFIGSVRTAVCNSGITILDLPAGVPVEFCWEADASLYGGTVIGYRYGWDVSDPDDPDQWDTDFTPFVTTEACAPAREFYFSTHTFTVEVVDNSGSCSRIEIKINIVQFLMNRNVIVVDDFPENPIQAGWTNFQGKGALPSDEEHDDFWRMMTENVSGFDSDQDMIEVAGGDVVPLQILANYKAMIWNVGGHVDQPVDDRPLLYDLTRFELKNPPDQFAGGKKQPNLLSLFMEAGGHVLIAGQHPVSMSINPVATPIAGGIRYPIIFQYELDGDQEGRPNLDDPPGNLSFAYKDLCLDVMDFSITGYSRRRGGSINFNCPITSLREAPPDGSRIHGMRAAIPIDPDFPYLALHDSAAGPNKAYEESRKALSVEVYNPQYFLDYCQFAPNRPRGCFEPIYGLECLDTDEVTYGQPVAFWTSVYADRVAEIPGAVAARSAVFGFPPVFFQYYYAQQAIERVLFDEWQLPRKPE